MPYRSGPGCEDRACPHRRREGRQGMKATQTGSPWFQRRGLLPQCGRCGARRSARPRRLSASRNYARKWFGSTVPLRSVHALLAPVAIREASETAGRRRRASGASGGEGLSYGETPHAAIALASPRLSVVLWRKDNGASRPASEIPSLTFRSRALSFASDHVTTVAATQVVGRIGRRQRRPRLRRRQPRLRRVGREARSRSGDQLIARGSRAGLDLAGRPGWQGGRSPSPRGTTTLPSLADVGTPAVGQD